MARADKQTYEDFHLPTEEHDAFLQLDNLKDTSPEFDDTILLIAQRIVANPVHRIYLFQTSHMRALGQSVIADDVILQFFERGGGFGLRVRLSGNLLTFHGRTLTERQTVIELLPSDPERAFDIDQTSERRALCALVDSLMAEYWDED